MKALALALLVPGVALAEVPHDTAAAIEVDRQAPPPGRTELGFDGGADVPGWGVTVSGGWLERPIVLRTADGDSAAVARRETLGLGAALAVGTYMVIDLRFSLAHQTGQRLRAAGDPRPLDRWVPGDLQLGWRLRLTHLPRFSGFVRGDLTLTTGDEHDFAGELAWGGAWSLIGRFTLPANITLAVNGGVRLRPAEVLVGDRVVANEVFGAAGVVVPLPPMRPLWCDPEYFKLTAELAGIAGDSIGGQRGPSPVEARLGFVGRPRPDLYVGVRAGVGLVDEIGAPRWRALLELTYQGHGQLVPPRPPADEPALDQD